MRAPPDLADLAHVHRGAAALAARPPAPPRVQTLAACEVDGHDLSTHPRCRRCRILVGPHHSRETLHDGYCERCYLDVRSRRLSGCAKAG